MSKEERNKLDLINNFSYEQVVEMIIYYQEIELYKDYLLEVHPQLKILIEKIQEITNITKHSQILIKERKCKN
jgi:hypothetical protein